MCTIVNAMVPTAEFALHDTFEEMPLATFETVRTAVHDTNQPMPFLWAAAPEPDALDAALRADATTDTVQVVTRTDGRRLYRIQWRPRTCAFLRTLVESDGSVLEASARDGRWAFKLLFPDHRTVSRAYDRCQEQGIDLRVRQVKNDGDPMEGSGSPLSNEQHEALVTAFRADYYRVPRGVTQVELAERVDLSHQALSERLRRGHRGLISYMLRDGTIQGAP